jgi:hypothetical protein
MSKLEGKLREEGIDYQMSKEMDSRGILGCLEKIDNADLIYVVDPEGYVGKSVCIDIGYAYGKNKLIYAMHSIEDPDIMGMVHGVLSFEELVSFLKKGCAFKA